MKLSLNEFQLYCLKQRVSFVSYSLPGDIKPVTLFATGDDIKAYDRLTGVTEQCGFLLSPFQSEDFPVLIFPTDHQLTGWEIDLDESPKPGTDPVTLLALNNQDSSEYQQYAGQVDEITRSIRAGEAKKVVLSRTKIWTGIEPNLLPDVFEELVRSYVHAFVYILYTPNSGIWLGATPELLMEMDDSTFMTMALAGTKAVDNKETQITWTEKELKEHSYVSDYVRKQLSLGGYAFHESGMETVNAGNVVHLRTLFQGRIGHGKPTWKELVSMLYPTPAICGTEKEATLQLIRKIEKHRREYYAGIIGAFDETGRTDLFVNLRCMKIVGNAAILYAGGGILGESVASKEWEETELKFNTLIQVVKRVKERMKVNK